MQSRLPYRWALTVVMSCLLGLIMSVGSTWAAKPTKVNICHAGKNGTYSLRAVNESRISTHIPGHEFDIYPTVYYEDLDFDGWGTTNNIMNVCPESVGVQVMPPPDGYAEANPDCDDNDDTVFGPIPFFEDNDGDGYGKSGIATAEFCEGQEPPGYVTISGDCDDMDNEVNPDATEILRNGKDDDCDPSTPDNTHTTVFITSVKFGANFGGLSGADTACKNRATAAGLTENYVAWLSDSQTDARARIPQDGPYMMLDETILANQLSDLLDGWLDADIVIDEFGNTLEPVFGDLVWTGTTRDGRADPDSEHCLDWTDTQINLHTVMLGDPTPPNNPGLGQWTEFSIGADCHQEYRLYCFGR